MFALTIIGSNSALPAFGRNPTSQVLQTTNELHLIDCGEGTQLQLSKYKIKRSRIRHIYISHLHGDHYFGLIGLITSMGLMNRTEELHIFAPADLEKIIQLQLDVADTTLPYPLYFHALKEGVVADTKQVQVTAFRVEHRIACWGFLFKEKKNARSLLPEKVRSYEIPESFYPHLQKGEDYVNAKGTIIPNSEVTTEAALPKSYAYCADTMFHEPIAEIVKGVDLLYHETTYLDDLSDHAKTRFHSTTKQAGTIALKANAKRLVIGHFSSKYEELEPFLKETCEIFSNTELAIEGCCFRI